VARALMRSHRCSNKTCVIYLTLEKFRLLPSWNILWHWISVTQLQQCLRLCWTLGVRDDAEAMLLLA
jgi:hypothetical protein